MKYRKKPVVIEAEQFTEESKNRVFRWAAERNGGVYPSADESGEPVLQIPTLEGEMTASLGDYIICGVAGELYPCKQDIFDRTYEAVNAEPKARSNFDRIAADKREMAFYLMCPHGKSAPDAECAGKSCMDCSLEWLDRPAKEE